MKAKFKKKRERSKMGAGFERKFWFSLPARDVDAVETEMAPPGVEYGSSREKKNPEIRVKCN